MAANQPSTSRNLNGLELLRNLQKQDEETMPLPVAESILYEKKDCAPLRNNYRREAHDRMPVTAKEDRECWNIVDKNFQIRNLTEKDIANETAVRQTLINQSFKFVGPDNVRLKPYVGDHTGTSVRIKEDGQQETFTYRPQILMSRLHDSMVKGMFRLLLASLGEDHMLTPVKAAFHRDHLSTVVGCDTVKHNNVYKDDMNKNQPDKSVYSTMQGLKVVDNLIKRSSVNHFDQDGYPVDLASPVAFKHYMNLLVFRMQKGDACYRAADVAWLNMTALKKVARINAQTDGIPDNLHTASHVLLVHFPVFPERHVNYDNDAPPPPEARVNMSYVQIRDLYNQQFGSFNYTFELLRKIPEAERVGERADATHELMIFRTLLNPATAPNSRIEHFKTITSQLAAHLTELIALSVKKVADRNGQPYIRPSTRIVTSMLPFPACYLSNPKYARSHNWADTLIGPMLLRCWGTGLPYVTDFNDLTRFRRQAGCEIAFYIKMAEPVLNPEYEGRPRKALYPTDAIVLAQPHSTAGGYGRPLDTASILTKQTDWLQHPQWKDHDHFIYPLDMICIHPEGAAPDTDELRQLAEEAGESLPAVTVEEMDVPESESEAEPMSEPNNPE